MFKSLGENSLSRESAVAVHQQRKELFFPAIAGAVLLGAGAADSYGIDGFKVARIRNQVNVDLGAAASLILSGRAHVIFHIAAAQNAARIDIFESGKNFFGRALSPHA